MDGWRKVVYPASTWLEVTLGVEFGAFLLPFGFPWVPAIGSATVLFEISFPDEWDGGV
jgi:hypothetical protein